MNRATSISYFSRPFSMYVYDINWEQKHYSLASRFLELSFVIEGDYKIDTNDNTVLFIGDQKVICTFNYYDPQNICTFTIKEGELLDWLNRNAKHTPFMGSLKFDGFDTRAALRCFADSIRICQLGVFNDLICGSYNHWRQISIRKGLDDDIARNLVIVYNYPFIYRKYKFVRQCNNDILVYKDHTLAYRFRAHDYARELLQHSAAFVGDFDGYNRSRRPYILRLLAYSPIVQAEYGDRLNWRNEARSLFSQLDEETKLRQQQGEPLRAANRVPKDIVRVIKQMIFPR